MKCKMIILLLKYLMRNFTVQEPILNRTRVNNNSQSKILSKKTITLS
jgi:hypothetical protein